MQAYTCCESLCDCVQVLALCSGLGSVETAVKDHVQVLLSLFRAHFSEWNAEKVALTSQVTTLTTSCELLRAQTLQANAELQSCKTDLQLARDAAASASESLTREIQAERDAARAWRDSYVAECQKYLAERTAEVRATAEAKYAAVIKEITTETEDKLASALEAARVATESVSNITSVGSHTCTVNLCIY